MFKFNFSRPSELGVKGLGAIGAIALLAAVRPAYAQDRFFAVNYGDPRVREYQAGSGAFLGDAASLRDANGPYGTNSDLAFNGTYYYTINGYGTLDGVNPDQRVRTFDLNGNFVGDAFQLHEVNGTPVKQAQTGVGTDGKYFYSIAPNDDRVRKFDLTGMYLGDACLLTEKNGTPVQQSQVAIDCDGAYFYTVANNDPRVRQFTLAGVFIGDVLDLGGSGTASINNTGIAVYRVPAPSSVAPEPGSVALLVLGMTSNLPAALMIGRRRNAV